MVCLVRSSRYITQKEITKNDQLEHRSILSMIESIIKIVKKRKIKNKSRTNKQEQQQQQQKVGVVNKCRFGFWLLSLFLFISFMVHETQQKKEWKKTKRIMESKERITQKKKNPNLIFYFSQTKIERIERNVKVGWKMLLLLLLPSSS